VNSQETLVTESKFDDAVRAYLQFASAHGMAPSQSLLRAEAHVESLRDWAPEHSLDDVKSWFEARRANCEMAIQYIALDQCRRWSLDPSTGFIKHDSGDFFTVQGLRVTTSTEREVQSGWDQPMLTQVGFDGGILGLLRQRRDGAPMYLAEAKAEPGNYRIIQLSPTIQATYANIRQSHGGRKPRFAEYFDNTRPSAVHVHFDQWLSEDGGRLTNKRNRGMLVEVPTDHEIVVPDGFLWVSLWQIKELLHEDAWVNPHIRGIIAHL